jgi:hypothetical protein
MLQHINNPLPTTKEESKDELLINNTKVKRDKVDEVIETKDVKNKSSEKKGSKKEDEKSDKKIEKKIEEKNEETDKREENTVKTNIQNKKNTDKLNKITTKMESFEEKSVENSNDEMDIVKSFDSTKRKNKENISKKKKPLVIEENSKENKNQNNNEKTVINKDEENVYNNVFFQELNDRSPDKHEKSEEQENNKINNNNKRKYGQRKSENNIEGSIDDKDKPRSKKKRKIDKNGKIVLTETQYLKTIFKQLEEQNVKYFPIKEEKQEFFGVDNRYPRRKRFPVLNPIIGERLAYGVRMNNDTKVPEVIGIYRNNQFVREFQREHQLKAPKKRLVKKADKERKDKTETKLENLEETNKDEDKSEEDEKKKVDEEGEDKELRSYFYKVDKESTKLKTVFIIPKECEKPKAKNYDVKIECEVIETDGENCFITGMKKREKLKPGESFFISPNEVFSFQNFSTKKDMKVSLTVIK